MPNGVEINSKETAAIVGLAAEKITITLAEGTENILTDGGNSEYDGCIFSNAELVFEGEGKLTVTGQQNEGEGIATEAQNITFNGGVYYIISNDDGINAGGDGATITINGGTFYIDAGGDGIDSNKNAVINGGTVVALGSDMIELPGDASAQNTIAFTADSVIGKDTVVTLAKDGEAVISFSANKSFITIIISSDLEYDEYSLHVGGSYNGELANGIIANGLEALGDKISVNGTDVFTVSKTVNSFGGRGR